MLKWHPDKNKSQEATVVMQLLNDIKETLSIPYKKILYDKKIELGKEYIPAYKQSPHTPMNKNDNENNEDNEDNEETYVFYESYGKYEPDEYDISDDEYCFDNNDNNYGNICKLGNKCWYKNCERQHPEGHIWMNVIPNKIASLKKQLNLKNLIVVDLAKKKEIFQSQLDHILLCGNPYNKVNLLYRKIHGISERIKTLKLEIKNIKISITELGNSH